MTEKEKMQKQMLYDANYDEALLKERLYAKDLCYEFNLTRPSDVEGQDAILKKLIGTIKGACTITAPFFCDYGYNIEFGENFYANHNLVILDCAKVTFGDNVFIAPDCGFHTAGHPLDYERRNKGLEYAYPITVGDNVWIGAGVHVMPGVTIGSNVVIGAGSVVTKDIPSNVLACGVPCKVIRELSTDGPIDPWIDRILDAASFDEKYRLVCDIREDISDKLINDLAAIFDLEIPDGNLRERYRQLQSCLRMRQRYEQGRMR